MSTTVRSVRPGRVSPRPPTGRLCRPRRARGIPSVAAPAEIWRADPFDVDSIHTPAREAFERLVHRAAHVPPPPAGAVLVLLGEAGSGKTHLMRAFRTRAHGQNLGYCAYMQMTTEVTSYPRYMLQNLIKGLEQPYAPEGPSRTGLAWRSAALLEMVPELDATVAAGSGRTSAGTRPSWPTSSRTGWRPSRRSASATWSGSR